MAPFQVSGGPGAFAISFTGIDLATASSTNSCVSMPLATLRPPAGVAFSLSAGLATPRIGGGVLSLLGVSGGSATGIGALPLQGRIGAGASSGPFVITSLSASSFGPGVGGPLLVATTTNMGIARISDQGVFGELTLRFVPEPDAMLLLLLGSGLLAALGQRRRR